MAQLAAARGRGRPGRPADHVHRGRWSPAAGAGADPPEGLRRQPPGADRQRRGVQRQNDVLGEVMIALSTRATPASRRRRELGAPARPGRRARRPLGRARQRAVGDPRAQHHFTHSRVMVWVAFDRAIRAVEVHGLPGRSGAGARCGTWSGRDPGQGFDDGRNTFTQHYDTPEVDATLLTLSLVGFLPGDDPRVLGTIDAMVTDLMRDGLLLRYRTQTGVDGLAGDEHPFLACSFWLVSPTPPPAARTEAEELWTGSARWPTTWAAVRGVRHRERPDGRQLPAGVQPPDPGAGGAGVAVTWRARPPLTMAGTSAHADGPATP